MAEQFETGSKRKFEAINRRAGANSLDATGMEFGKIPPQSRDFEEAVLGAVMIEADVMADIKFLRDEMFYVDAHLRIFKAISQLSAMESPIDILTVTEQLKKNGDLEAVGGGYYLMQLTNKVGSAANLEYHAKIVHQKWLARMAIATSSGIIREAYEDSADAIAVIDEAVGNFVALSDGMRTNAHKDIRTVVSDISMEMTVRRYTKEEDKKPLGMSTGIEPLDAHFLGYMPSNLIIIGGNPSEGKSTTAIQSIRHIVKFQKLPASFFSLEMSTKEIIQKLCSMESGVGLDKIISCVMSDYEWKLVDAAFDEIANWPLYICDTGGIEILELFSLAKSHAAKYGVKVIVADYLQLITVSAATCKAQGINNKEGKVSFISEKLKELAKKLDIPVIALAQLSRENEKRSGDNKRPQNSDLRDSGAIEQNADIIIFVFRPEKHGITNYSGDSSSTAGITEFIISKYRMGPLMTIKAKFRGANSIFVDIDEFEATPKQGTLMPLDEAKKKNYKDGIDDIPF